MAIAPNQYATRVFADHPIALWSLDEQAYYLSLINDNNRLFTTWTITGCTASNSPTLPATPSPFDSTIYSSVTKSTTATGTIEMESPNLFSVTDVNVNDLKFNVNFFMYQNPTFINWFKVGYRYLNASSVPQEVLSAAIPPPTSASWVNFNNVYTVPTSWSGSLKIFIQVNFADSTAGDSTSRTVIMTGLSVGQDSQTTCYDSLGSVDVALPGALSLTGMTGVTADQYGVLADNGYYLVRDNVMLANNQSMPIIYGTDHSTQIISSGVNLPSMVFPGKGMLHENGRNKFFTYEMWMKIDPSTSTALRILGPLNSTDGVFVKEGFITLSVDGEIASHFVGEWYRPMLLHLVFKDRNIVMMINGESVLTIPFDRKTAVLSNQNDWWAIYSYPAIAFFAVDCIAVYPYIVPEAVAKRRFVYGQGTPGIQYIDGSYAGTPTTIEFATAEYDPSIIYPDIARWDAGYFNNLSATRNYLSVPNYTLPVINIGGRDVNQWYADNLEVNTLEYPSGNHPRFITFRPNKISGVWDSDGINYTAPSYFNFPSLNVLNDQVAAVYGVFEVEKTIASARPLMSFVNVSNGDTFKITINSSTIAYTLNGTVLYSESITVGTENLVGINLATVSQQFGAAVSKFFSSPSSIQLYVGGDGVTTFEGKIYAVGICNQTNYDDIAVNFNANGTTIKTNYQILLDHFASYTLLPEKEYSRMYLDVSVAAKWEEYFPLSYFASYVKDDGGNLIYDVEALQINIGYPTVSSSTVWIYSQLRDDPTVGTIYSDLRDGPHNTYFDLKKNNSSGNTLSTAGSSLQSYISFQPLASAQNTPLDSISYTRSLDLDSVIYADEEAFPYDTAFSFKDNVVVFPPKLQDFNNYSMVVHLELRQRSILKNPLKIRSLEIAAKNLNYKSPNYIGSKYGKKIYPAVNVLAVTDYKATNPITIYKAATPYLYLTKNSGIRIIEESASTTPSVEQHHAFIPINESGAFDYEVAGLQLMLKTDFIDDNTAIKLIEIRHKNGILLYTLNKSGTTATMSTYSRTSENIVLDGGAYNTSSWAYVFDGGVPTSIYPDSPYVDINTGPNGVIISEAAFAALSGTAFYQNGRYVTTPIVTNGEWNTVGLVFPTKLDFSEYADGGIRIYGGSTLNNISYYLTEGLGTKTTLSTRTWQQVFDQDGAVPAGTTWSYWTGTTWQGVYILGQVRSYISTPEDIFDAYVGTNAEVVDDGYGVIMGHKNPLVISNATWSTLTLKPA